MRVIRIFTDAQPVKIPHFKSTLTCKQDGDPIVLLHIFYVHIMKVNYAKFHKKVVVEKFQGNYLKARILIKISLFQWNHIAGLYM